MKTIEKIKQISTEYKIGDFFRNFLAVILGIAITFAGSDWMENRKTKKEIKDALQLVNVEMQTNQETIQKLIECITLEQQSAKYLLEYKDRINEMPIDSLKKYANLPLQFINITFNNNAMEMLKASGLIQKIENKELALQILTIYTEIQEVEKAFSAYTETKKELQKNLDNIPNIMHWNTQKTNIRDIWKFYFKYPEGIQLVQRIPEIQSIEIYQNRLKHINEVINFIKRENV